MKKMKINNRLYNVISIEEYNQNPELYNPRFTAIETNGYVYPIKSKNDTGVGIFHTPGNMASIIQKPETGIEEYDAKNIIDYSIDVSVYYSKLSL